MRVNIVSQTVLLALLFASIAGSSILGATTTFDDLPLGYLEVPGTFESNGTAWMLTGPGTASIGTVRGFGQSLRLDQGAGASVDLPGNTTAADFLYYNVVSLSSFSVNGDSLAFERLAGTTGTIGGVEYLVTSNSRFNRVTLLGPISSLTFSSGPTLNALILDEVTVVPEPSSWQLTFAIGLSCDLTSTRRKRRRMLVASRVAAPWAAI